MNLLFRPLRVIFCLCSIASLHGGRAPTSEVFDNALWSPDHPCCILVDPEADDVVLPPIRHPLSLHALFGAGVDEDVLASAGLPGVSVIAPLEGVDAVTVSVCYTDPTGTGFNNAANGALRKAAFEYAADRVAQLVNGSGTLSIDVSFAALGSGTLASAGPTGFYTRSGLPMSNTFYPEFLVEILTGTDPNTGQCDVTIQFDNTTNWYYGTDGNPGSGQRDFVTVAMHETMHGLGFSDSFTSTGSFGLGTSGDPTIYDRFLVDGTGTSLVSKSPSSSNVTGTVRWGGTEGVTHYRNHFGGSGNVPIFAPNPYQGGSSISHLNESTFTGTWELMTPSYDGPQHTVDTIVLGMLEDMGYTMSFSALYVDANYSGVVETGHPRAPYKTLASALSVALSSGKRIFMAGASYPEAPLTIDQNVTLLLWGGAGATVH